MGVKRGGRRARRKAAVCTQRPRDANRSRTTEEQHTATPGSSHVHPQSVSQSVSQAGRVSRSRGRLVSPPLALLLSQSLSRLRKSSAVITDCCQLRLRLRLERRDSTSVHPVTTRTSGNSKKQLRDVRGHAATQTHELTCPKPNPTHQFHTWHTQHSASQHGEPSRVSFAQRARSIHPCLA